MRLVAWRKSSYATLRGIDDFHRAMRSRNTFSRYDAIDQGIRAKNGNISLSEKCPSFAVLHNDAASYRCETESVKWSYVTRRNNIKERKKLFGRPTTRLVKSEIPYIFWEEYRTICFNHREWKVVIIRVESFDSTLFLISVLYLSIFFNYSYNTINRQHMSREL